MITLASMSVTCGKVDTDSVVMSSTPDYIPQQLTTSFAEKLSSKQPKSIVITEADVKSLPCFSGSVEVGIAGDVDILSVLHKYRVVVGFRGQTARPGDEAYGDAVAYEFFSLILDGSAATMYQLLMSGCIKLQAYVMTN